MELIVVSLMGLAAVFMWALVRLVDLALAWKLLDKVQESQVDVNLQALTESLKDND